MEVIQEVARNEAQQVQKQMISPSCSWLRGLTSCNHEHRQDHQKGLTLLLRKGEVPIDVVRAVSEADFLAVRIQKQLYTTAIQAVPRLRMMLQIGLQAGCLVVRGMWLLGFFGSATLEQALYRPGHKGSERRSGSFGQGAAVWGVGSARKPRATAQEPRRGSCSFA